LKTGIITIFEQSNYGNRLQNYAVSKLLRKYGKPETIVIQFERSIKKKVKDWFLDNHGIAFRNKVPYRIPDVAIERRVRFVQFTERNIPLRYFMCSSVSDLQRLRQDYDFFVAGSDQIWNPLFWNNDGAERLFNLYFLTFAPAASRIALSASIGINAVPQEWKERFSEEWKKFRAISVREDRGAEIIRECCGRDAPVLLDPTLALPKEEWRRLADRDVKLPKSYALTCFLGNKTAAYRRIIGRLLKAQGLDCVELNNPAYPEYYRLGPDGFLAAVEGADIIFTDSFHAVVFSIIFEKPFAAFDRVESGMCAMNSRMETLFGKLGLRDRIYSGESCMDIDVGELLSRDYNQVKRRLKEGRKAMQSYLEDVFITEAKDGT
jgi:hypothetical protein